MPRTLYFYCLGLILVFSACNRNASESAIRDTIMRALDDDRGFLLVPRGDVEIMSGLSSQFEKNDFERKRFTADFSNSLELYRKNGLLTFAQREQSELQAVGRMGASTITVTPSKRAVELSDQQRSSKDYLLLRIYTFGNIQIIRNELFRPLGQPQSEERYLVLGTGHAKASDWSQEMKMGAPEYDFKFRALLELNPFTKHYSCKGVDLGFPDRDGWESNNAQ